MRASGKMLCASRHAKCGHCKCRAAKAHHHETRDMGEEIELENSPGPEKHNSELGEGKQDVEDQLAGQQPGHGDARAEHAIERAGFSLVEQSARGAAGGEEQKHDSDGRGVEGDHWVVLVFSHHRARRDGDHSAAGWSGM